MGVLTDEEKADFDKVQEAFYNSDDLFTQYEAFAGENCDVFSLDEAEEQKLEYQVVYNKFKDTFESAFEKVISGCGVSAEGFQASCVKLSEAGAARDGDDGRRWDFLSFVLAMSDYDTFALLMRQAKEQKSGAPQEV